MPTRPAVRHILDITRDLLRGLDPDAEPRCRCAGVPGRIHVHVGCGLCGAERHWNLPRGRWAIDHTHEGVWTAHLLRLTVPGDEQPGPRRCRGQAYDPAALATLLAPTLAGADR